MLHYPTRAPVTGRAKQRQEKPHAQRQPPSLAPLRHNSKLCHLPKARSSGRSVRQASRPPKTALPGLARASSASAPLQRPKDPQGPRKVAYSRETRCGGRKETHFPLSCLGEKAAKIGNMPNPRHLLLRLATLTLALAAIFAPQNASAKSHANSETRVRDFSAALPNLTQTKPDLTPDSHYEKLAQLRQLASGPPLGAKGGAKRGNSGHGTAGEVLEGGTGKAFAGHGHVLEGAPTTIVPEGTSITFHVRHGEGMWNYDAMLVEKGVYGSFSETFGPGARIPNYILDAPDSMLTIMSKSHTVNVPTTLGDLLKPGMGRVDWAACRTCYSP